MADVLRNPPHIRDVGRGPELDAALATVGAFLAKEGLTGLLSVGLRHRHFNIDPEREALLEETNEEDRTQTRRVVDRTDIRDDQATSWEFTSKGKPVPGGWCSWYGRYHG